MTTTVAEHEPDDRTKQPRLWHPDIDFNFPNRSAPILECLLEADPDLAFARLFAAAQSYRNMTMTALALLAQSVTDNRGQHAQLLALRAEYRRLRNEGN